MERTASTLAARYRRLLTRSPESQGLQSVRVGAFFLAGEFGAISAAELPGIGALCAVFLDPMRAAFGTCTIVSGKRSDAKNAEVGGAPESRHLYARRPLQVAADVTLERGTSRDWADFARRRARALGRGGVGYYTTHVHVDLGSEREWLTSG